MNGKSRCKILKELRQEIARSNDITLVTSECRYQGDCPGTCPKCEAEVRYLEKELLRRQQAGKKITLAGLAAAVTLTATACQTPMATMGDMVPESFYSENATGELETTVTEKTDDEVFVLQGDLPLPDEETEVTTTVTTTAPLTQEKQTIPPRPLMGVMMAPGVPTPGEAYADPERTVRELEGSYTRESLFNTPGWQEVLTESSEGKNQDVFCLSPEESVYMTVTYDKDGLILSVRFDNNK